MSIVIGPKGPRGPPGPTGAPGPDFTPSMTSLGSNIAIVTDQSTVNPEPGKYYRSYTSISNALSNPSIDHIIVHRTQDETIPVVTRTITITGIGTPMTLTMTGSTLSSNITIRRLSVNVVNALGTLSILDSNVSIRQTFPSSSSITLKRCTVTVDDIIPLAASSMTFQACRVTLSPIVPVLADVDANSEFISFNNDYTYLTEQLPTFVSVSIGARASSSNDIVRLPGVGPFSVFPGGSSNTFCTSMTILSDDPNLEVTDNLEAVTVNGKYSNSTYRRADWYAYPSRTITSSTVLSPTDRTIIVSGSNITITINGPGDGRDYVFSVDAGTNRSIVLGAQVISLPITPVDLKLIIIGSTLYQLAG
uniref:Uncharacterized protein n=1 Tax=viral metagenome TaxID=1070528 RepID=A0A6C0BK77_9ZZZZ